MICGVLLRNRKNELVIWSRAAGFYQLSDDLQDLLRNANRDGEWVDFKTENGRVTSIAEHDLKLGGSIPVRVNNRTHQFFASILIPTVSQSAQIQWNDSSVYCSFFGKVLTSSSQLGDLRKHDTSLGYQAWVEWDPENEIFYLSQQEIRSISPDKQSALRLQQARIPWQLENVIDLGWSHGLIGSISNYCLFVSTDQGDFILNTESQRLGEKAPELGSFVRCKLRKRNSTEKWHHGDVIKYEVQPMPCDCRMDHVRGTGNQCLFRCEAELISLTTDNGIPNLECSISANIYDINFKISMAQIGVFYDVIIKRPHPKEHTLCEGEWVVERVIGQKSTTQPNSSLNSSNLSSFQEDLKIRRESPQFISFDRRSQKHQSPNIRSREISPQTTLFDARSDDSHKPVSRKTHSKLDYATLCTVITVFTRFHQEFPETRAFHRNSNQSQPGTLEMRGICVNRTKAYNFISFSNDIEAVYPVKDARKKLEINAGDHLRCEVREILDKRENEQPSIRYEILDYQKIPSPTGWSMDGIMINGLAKLICPLKYRRLNREKCNHQYPIYYNELMDIVHDYDRRSIELGEPLNEEALKCTRLIAEVTRTRIPGKSGKNGWMLQRMVEKTIQESFDEEMLDESKPSTSQYMTSKEMENFSRNMSKGIVTKKWGFFLVVWLSDGRLTLIDTRRFQNDGVPELGTFIECHVIPIAVILDRNTIYKWEVIEMYPFYLTNCNGFVENEETFIHCHQLTFEGYRLVEKTRQAHFSHPFFGKICDIKGVFYLSPQPGDPIEAYIKAIPNGESSLQWIIVDEKNMEASRRAPPRAIVAPLNHLRIVDDDERSEKFSKSSSYSHFDTFSTSTSCGTNDEIKQITSRAARSADGEDRETGQQKAKTYEELIRAIVDHPGISNTILEIDPDLFAEILSFTI